VRRVPRRRGRRARTEPARRERLDGGEQAVAPTLTAQEVVVRQGVQQVDRRRGVGERSLDHRLGGGQVEAALEDAQLVERRPLEGPQRGEAPPVDVEDPVAVVESGMARRALISLAALLAGYTAYRLEAGPVAGFVASEGYDGDRFRPGPGVGFAADMSWHAGSEHGEPPRGFGFGYTNDFEWLWMENRVGQSAIDARSFAWRTGLPLAWGFEGGWWLAAAPEIGASALHFEPHEGWDVSIARGMSFSLARALGERGGYVRATLTASRTEHTSGDYLFTPLRIGAGWAF